MKRLLRILLNAATLVSLLLFIAISALWIKSHQPRDAWGGDATQKTAWTLVSGQLIAVRMWMPPDVPSTGTRTNNITALPGMWEATSIVAVRSKVVGGMGKCTRLPVGFGMAEDHGQRSTVAHATQNCGMAGK